MNKIDTFHVNIFSSYFIFYFIFSYILFLFFSFLFLFQSWLSSFFLLLTLQLILLLCFVVCIDCGSFHSWPRLGKMWLAHARGRSLLSHRTYPNGQDVASHHIRCGLWHVWWLVEKSTQQTPFDATETWT
jgi:hypothetical protein